MAASSSNAVAKTLCHQCRQSNESLKVYCTALRKNNKQCVLKYCHKCLWNRYQEKVENPEDWSCPKCREICDCSECMKNKGAQPKGRKRPIGEMVVVGEQSDVQQDANSEEKSDIVGEAEESGKGGGKKKSKRMKLERLNVQQNDETVEEISLPVGNELTSVAGIDISTGNAANALQFTEFCSAFGKFLEIEEGQAENVLRDIFLGRIEDRGEVSTIVQFHIHLLTILLDDIGKAIPEMQDSWFNELKDSLYGSQKVLKAEGLDFLKNMDDYESLDAAQKLRLLNILCDEVLLTVKVRNWIEDEGMRHLESVKEMKKNLAKSTTDEKDLKKKMKDDITAAVSVKNGAALSSSEHEDIVSNMKPELEKAHANVLESEGILEKLEQIPNMVRLEPILTSGGHSYWKPNASDKGNVLCQNVGKGDTLGLNEQWTIMDDVGKNTIENHVRSLRDKRKEKRPSAARHRKNT